MNLRIISSIGDSRYWCRSRTVLSVLSLVLLGFWLPRYSWATVGGPSYSEVLGFDRVRGEINLIEDRQDGAGFMPSLFRYHLSSGVLTEAYNHQDWYWNAFGAAMKELRARLEPLVNIPVDAGQQAVYRWQFTPLPPKEVPSIQFEDERMTVYPMQVDFWRNDQVQRFRIERCRDGEVPQLIGLYDVSGIDAGLAVFRYLGLCYEGGYERDHVVYFPAVRAERREELSVYTVQLMAGSESGIRTLEQRVRSAGYDPYLAAKPEVPDTVEARLRIGFFFHRADAQRLAASLGQQFSLAPVVMEVDEDPPELEERAQLQVEDARATPTNSPTPPALTARASPAESQTWTQPESSGAGSFPMWLVALTAIELLGLIGAVAWALVLRQRLRRLDTQR